MFARFSQQVFGGEIIGVYADMEGRVAQNCTQSHRRGVDSIAGNHVSFQTVGSQRQAAAGGGKRIDVEQRHLIVWVTAFDSRAQNTRTATEIQQVAAGQFVQMLQQQRAAAIQSAVAENTRQADDFERAFSQWQFVGLREAFQRFGFRRIGHRHQPQLAVPCAVELAWLAEWIELFGGAFDAAFFLADQVQLAAGQPRGQGVEDVIGQILGLG
ncbi:hypothetical protein D3C86_1493110 [compost metagenome]